MRSPGSFVLATLALVATLWCGAALGAVTATVDRERVGLGETLFLTLSATGGEDPGAADLSPLLADFEILQRSSSSEMRIVNGRTSRTHQLRLELTPRREGELRIPALRIDGASTLPIPVTVTAAPDIDAGDQAVLFSAELDSDTVYVQGQLLLTLRLMQAINLDDRSVSELELEGAFVQPLEQRSFRREQDGRTWLVHEVRYAIFPERSGTLEIPAQVFTAREITARRGFTFGGSGRRLRRETRPLSVEVLPRPATYPDATWLPARDLTIEETWSTPPETLRAGESATRTITLRGEGLQGAQLPPVRFPDEAGLKFYPDQPQITDEETAGGLLGIRRDSAAIVPLEAGAITLPEIRIPWWDTESRRTRFAVLPARTLEIAPGAQAAAAPPPVAPVEPRRAPTEEAAPSEAPDTLPWQLLAAFSSLGWLATLGYLLFRRRRAAAGERTRHAGDGADSERACARRLREACAVHDAGRARSAVLQWARAASGRGDIATLSAVRRLWPDAELGRELDALDAALYRDGGQWNGSGLADCIERLRKTKRGGDGTRPALALYPEAT